MLLHLISLVILLGTTWAQGLNRGHTNNTLTLKNTEPMLSNRLTTTTPIGAPVAAKQVPLKLSKPLVADDSRNSRVATNTSKPVPFSPVKSTLTSNQHISRHGQAGVDTNTNNARPNGLTRLPKKPKQQDSFDTALTKLSPISLKLKNKQTGEADKSGSLRLQSDKGSSNLKKFTVAPFMKFRKPLEVGDSKQRDRPVMSDALDSKKGPGNISFPNFKKFNPPVQNIRQINLPKINSTSKPLENKRKRRMPADIKAMSNPLGAQKIAKITSIRNGHRVATAGSGH